MWLKIHLTIRLLLLAVYASQAQAVHSVSEMRNVMLGIDLGIHLSWDTISREHLYGISPLNRIEGEVTIIDGRIFTSTVSPKGKIHLKTDWNVRAPFGVYAHVAQWDTIRLEADLNGENALQQLVESAALSRGHNLNSAFPFRILGLFDTVLFHIISKPQTELEHNHELHDKAKKHFSAHQIQGELLGFYSQHHMGVFTHRGSFIHTHFIDQARRKMGHLDNIQCKGQILLLLPSPIVPANDFKVIDTDFSKGRLGLEQAISLSDLVKFHGHLCDGLVVGFQALSEGLLALYPDGVVDRTNTRVVSKPSPCLTDAAVYMTGGRFQFNTFYVDPEMTALFVVLRIDNGQAVGVSLNKNVKPALIDSLGRLADRQQLSACDLDYLRSLEDEFSNQLLKTSPKINYSVHRIEEFKWAPVLNNSFVKTDILNKNQPPCERLRPK